MRQVGPALQIALIDVEQGHAPWLTLTDSDGDVTRIDFVPAGNDLTATIDLAQFAHRPPSDYSIHLVEGPVRVDWLTVPWNVDNLTPVEEAGVRVVVTAPPPGGAALTIDVAPQVPRAPKVITRRLISRRNVLTVRADLLIAPHEVTAFELRLVDRLTGEVQAFPAQATRLPSEAGPWRRYRVEARVDWHDVSPGAREQYLDVSLGATMPDVGVATARVRASTGLLPRFAPLGWGLVERGDTGTYFGPRRTFKARMLTVYTATLPGDSLREFRRLSRGLPVRRWWYRRRHRPLWLIGELPYKAQDTGAAFFAYVCAEHPEIDARYVVAADSPDFAAVSSVGSVVVHGSPQHVEASLFADRVVGSHHPDYLFPARVPAMRRKIKAPWVFLQHGVMGTKWMANLYGRDLGGFATDLFLVSSPRERDLIRRDFRYRPEQIAVTGLSRFDTLLTPSEPERQIVVIPTWRDWVTSPEDFSASEFREAWQSLLTHPRFVRATAGNRVVVILHPNFRQFASDFDVPGVELLQQGDVAVQHLLRTSRLLITDFSSVGFDFALLHRPVVYFQFDRSRFLGSLGSHLDLDADLPGDVALNQEAALEAVERLAASGFVQDQADSALADSYFPMGDTRSSERIFAAVQSATRTRRRELTRQAATAARTVAAGLRRKRLDLPLLRVFYAAARLLPLRKHEVLFESDLGRGYGDSPKAVYLELEARGSNLHAVWASRVPLPGAGSDTQVVRRLSAGYFWHLARAKYLVNNQSFPSYVRRRRGQVFVQTWHGTPLKRMLHDLDQITGRDPGYSARATTGAAQWSILTSPNAHTTAALASAFRHSAQVLEVGYPRNDIFYGGRAQEVSQRTRRRLGLAPGRTLVLFAPTFRDRGLDNALATAPTEAIDFERFAAEFGDRATLVIRRHVLDTHRAVIPAALEHCIIDATSIPDVQELLVATDVLVTDYSSLFFDFLNTRRPCVFFAPDLEDYRDNLRGFYLDYAKDLPGPVATDMEHLLPLLRTAIDDGRFADFDLDAFAQVYCPADDGRAAARVVDAVFGTGKH